MREDPDGRRSEADQTIQHSPFTIQHSASDEIRFHTRQLAWRDEVRAFIRDHLTPPLLDELRESGNEGQGPLAREFVLKLRDRGWWGLPWPKEYGGLGRSAIEQWMFVDELEGAGAPMLPLTVTSVAPTIMRVGSEEQKQHWLPRIKAAEVEFALGYSEPEAGTDLAALRTRAVLDGDHLGRQRPEDVEHHGAHVELQLAGRAHRTRCPEAQGHLDDDRADGCTRRDRPGHLRVAGVAHQRAVPRQRARAA